jgi:Mg-chelatase subunit ChlD
MAKKKSVNRVGFLLDETGSMNVRRDETIVAVDNYFERLRTEKAVVTFATFDSEQGVNFRQTETKAKDIRDLDVNTYRPNAYTPLHDAVGKMLQTMQQQAGAGDKVLIVVVTDGEENCSQEYDLAKIQQLIQQQEAAGWAFAYIGVSADAWAGGTRMGMKTGSVMNIRREQVHAAMSAHGAATADFFAGRVDNRDLYAQSRHLVDDEKPEEKKPKK